MSKGKSKRKKSPKKRKVRRVDPSAEAGSEVSTAPSAGDEPEAGAEGDGRAAASVRTGGTEGAEHRDEETGVRDEASGGEDGGEGPADASGAAPAEATSDEDAGEEVTSDEDAAEAKTEPSPRRRRRGRAEPAPAPEPSVEAVSERGGLVFLGVIFALLLLAIAVGFFTE